MALDKTQSVFGAKYEWFRTPISSHFPSVSQSKYRYESPFRPCTTATCLALVLEHETYVPAAFTAEHKTFVAPDVA
jgi:hypothetical protein